jgi:hypothetical protein
METEAENIRIKWRNGLQPITGISSKNQYNT